MKNQKPIDHKQAKLTTSQPGSGDKPNLALRLLSRAALLILLVALVAACGTGPDTADPQEPGEPDAIQHAWQASAHASTFVLDDAGENNECARCHAPTNWVPTMDDMPDACLACKFEVADPVPLIVEQDWLDIPCIVCHEPDGDTVEPEIAWLEIAQIESYAQVESANELCLKCHGDESIPQHKFPQLGGAHVDYQCVQCHDAHDMAASCDSEACHADVVGAAVAIVGHDDDHQDVSCWACHDAGTLDVAPDQDLGYWTTILHSDDISPSGTIALVSHDIVTEVNCDRCHFADNPWFLSAEVAYP